MTKRICETVLSLFCIIFIYGCLLDRLLESKEQICLGKIWIEEENGVSIYFDQPVLFDTDIIKIIGAQPTKINPRNDEKDFEYIVSKIEDEINEIYNIPVSLQFLQKQGRYRLKKAHVNKNIKDILSYELLNDVLLSGCKAKRKGRTVEVDLQNVDREKLPKRKEIKQILGKPNPDRTNFNTSFYNYKLSSSDTAEIIIFFDNESERVSDSDMMSAVKITYFRYVLDVNFEKQVAIGKIKSWSDTVGLGFWAAFSP